MSKIYDIKENVMMLADYNDPETHKHLAYHIIISLGGNMKWKVNDEEILCRGICIDSQVVHVGNKCKEGALVFLFTITSAYGQSLKKRYLKGHKYCVLDEKIINEVCRKYMEFDYGVENNKNAISDEELFETLMKICGLNKKDACIYDKRINEILTYVKKNNTIGHSIMDELSEHVFLSKSRMSHIFKDETGMTLHSYLALQKLVKTSNYIDEGMNITEASIKAGFDTPSHCAATCKKMFGICLRDVYKTIK